MATAAFDLFRLVPVYLMYLHIYEEFREYELAVGPETSGKDSAGDEHPVTAWRLFIGTIRSFYAYRTWQGARTFFYHGYIQS